MRKIVFGVVLTLIVLFTFKYCSDQKEDKITLRENTALIQEQIKNVGKLVVTEGHFSEVFTYKNSKAVFADLLEAKKQAVVIVNADVTVSFDLSKIEYEIDEENKSLMKKYAALKSESEIQENDKDMLLKELLMKKKENVTLKTQV